MVMRVPGMRALVLSAFFGYAGFSLLMPMSPLWAVEGGADELGAGFVTTVLMITTILTQLLVDRLLRRFGWGRVFGFGLVMLGAPAALQALSPDLWLVLLTTAARGVGFGILTVCGASATASLVPPAKRGAALGIYGLATALPQLIFMPLAPVLAELFGMPIAIALGVVPMLGLVWTASLGRAVERALAEQDGSDGAEHAVASSGLAALRRIALPVGTLLVITAAGGVLLTFAPQLVADTGVSVAALFAMMGMSAVGRWRFGGLADRWGTRALLWPLMTVGALGLGVIALGLLPEIAWMPPNPSLIVGALLVGLAYGGLQTSTLVRAFADAGERNRQHASVAWNVSFDLGTAMGATVAGAIAVAVSFGAAFGVLTVVAVAMALVIVFTDTRRRGRAIEGGATRGG